MRGIIISIIISALLYALVACATMSLPDTATDAEKRAARCEDAKAAYAMAQKAFLLQADPSADAQRYWTLFSEGASIGISTYCWSAP